MKKGDSKTSVPDAKRQDSLTLGFVTAILSELDLEQVLAHAALAKFDCVEVMCWPVGKAERKYAGVTHIDVTNFNKAEASRVQTLCARHKIAISGLGYYPNVLDPDTGPRTIAHLKKVIAAAAHLGIGVVNTFVGRDWRKSVEDNWPQFLRVWKPLVRFAKEHDIRIAIENCPMLFTRDEWPGGKNLAYSPAIWRRMFEDIPSDYFGLNYDPSHLAWMQMDWLKPLHEFRSRLFHLHAKDVQVFPKRLDDVGILATPLEFHQPRVPGRGIIDWSKYIQTLRAIGYKGPLCIEVEDDTFPKTLTGRQYALRVARDTLAPLIKKKK